MRLEGSSAATVFALVAAPFILFLPKRWRCHKCGHVWDDDLVRRRDPHNVVRAMDSVSSLNVFAHVVDDGSFVAAARVLGISASAVEKSITRLEERASFHRQEGDRGPGRRGKAR